MFVQPGVEIRNEEEADSFWNDVATKSGINYVRKSEAWNGIEYSSATGNDIPLDVKLLSGFLEVDNSEFAEQGISFQEVKWSLCDFGIILIEFSLIKELSTISKEIAQNTEFQVQEAGRRVVSTVLSKAYSELRAVVKDSPQADKFVSFLGDRELEHGWFSRAFVLDIEDSSAIDNQGEFGVLWLGGGEAAKRTIDELKSQQIYNFAEWMNYVYLRDSQTLNNPGFVEQMWVSLCRAQYFYAAMTRIDTNLMEILAWTMADPKEVSVSKLKEQLKYSMNQAEALFLKKAEVGKYANPASRVEMERILGAWDTEKVLIEPIKMKLDVCQSRLTGIDNEKAESSAFFTDVILMVIGVTSILGTALSIVGLGRGTSEDPNQAMYDFGAGSLTGWISAQPIDVIVLISAIISLLMIIAFISARRTSVS